MKSYVILGCIVILTIVSSVRSNVGYHKFLISIPEATQTKCLGEADLVADKEQVLSDESKVDPAKLSCYTACAFRESGAMVDGNIVTDVLQKQMDEVFAGDANMQARKDSINNCLGEAKGATDCEKIATLTTCSLKKLADQGID